MLVQGSADGSGVGLCASNDAGYERQQADPDHVIATLADYNRVMPPDAGEISPAQVEALFARIRAEVGAGSVANLARIRAEVGAGSVASEQASAEGSVEQLAARDEAERLWAVSAERGVVRGPGLKGAVAYPVKRLLRPFLRWYIEPALVEQRQFNATVLRLIDELAERSGKGSTRAEQSDQNGT